MSLSNKELLDALKVPFPHDEVEWRAQKLYGESALAFAYIDARAAQDRLDNVMGGDNWKCRYEFEGKRTMCYLALRFNGEWIEKADGAGDTAVEAEKGAISDSFKRAAVVWGVGRYLYSIDAVWVPCELSNGKFKKFKENPWGYVKGSPPELRKEEIPENIIKLKIFVSGAMENMSTAKEYTDFIKKEDAIIKQLKDYGKINKAFNRDIINMILKTKKRLQGEIECQVA